MEDVSNDANTLDVRDLIKRFEELEAEAVTQDDLRRLGYSAFEGETIDDLKAEEVKKLSEDDDADMQDVALEYLSIGGLLSDIKGYGGDEQWRGDWYPITLVRDSYWQEYAEELAESIGAINGDMRWPYTHIDWEAAAYALQGDYASAYFDGVTYWYR